jgi:Tryptophan halogenase
MQPIQKILVVGGGTAGWLAALYLNKALPKVRIEVVESQDIPPIGVGESTVPTLKNTLKFLDIDEAEFIKETGGSYKLGIRFESWQLPHEHSFFHPFFPSDSKLVTPYLTDFSPVSGAGFDKGHYWLKALYENHDIGRYDDVCHPIVHFCKKYQSPKYKSVENTKDLKYAYHIDAAKFARYMRKLCKHRGVKHYFATVTDVEINESQDKIIGVRLDKHKLLKADFFVDCSGFNRILIGKALGVPFLSDDKSLFCNAAVAIQCQHNPRWKGEIPAYTTSRALSSGWMWDVPLQERSGAGYVFSSKHLSFEEAENELRYQLRKRGVGVHHEVKYLQFKVGRNAFFWKGNCLSLGLSSMFIEPLEATSILLIELQLGTFLSFFPDMEFQPTLARAYNYKITEFYEEIRDFIVMHYILSDRTDSNFWKDVKYLTMIPDSLAIKLETFKQMLPGLENFQSKLFPSTSYTCILAGMNKLPVKYLPILKNIPDHYSYKELLKDKDSYISRIEPIMVSHKKLLNDLVYENTSGS